MSDRIQTARDTHYGSPLLGQLPDRGADRGRLLGDLRAAATTDLPAGGVLLPPARPGRAGRPGERPERSLVRTRPRRGGGDVLRRHPRPRPLPDAPYGGESCLPTARDLLRDHHAGARLLGRPGVLGGDQRALAGQQCCADRKAQGRLLHHRSGSRRSVRHQCHAHLLPRPGRAGRLSLPLRRRHAHAGADRRRLRRDGRAAYAVPRRRRAATGR